MNSLVSLVLIFSFAQPEFEARRQRMVEEHIASRGVKDKAVLKAMREIPRHLFVPEALRAEAYADHPLPIGLGQTISQPYIVAVMTEMLEPKPELTVLEIGTGSGYQAAILAKLFRDVYTIELLPELAETARGVFRQLNLTNIHTKVGDGYLGWPEHAPYDRILLTAAPPEVPAALIDQLAKGGRLVGPVGGDPNFQYLVIVDKDKAGRIHRRTSHPVRFVPMVPGRR
jgi:protein-L-isoaspartate(D-aspartate) O-methyltransferase